MMRTLVGWACGSWVSQASLRRHDGGLSPVPLRSWTYSFPPVCEGQWSTSGRFLCVAPHDVPWAVLAVVFRFDNMVLWTVIAADPVDDTWLLFVRYFVFVVHQLTSQSIVGFMCYSKSMWLQNASYRFWTILHVWQGASSNRCPLWIGYTGIIVTLCTVDKSFWIPIQSELTS